MGAVARMQTLLSLFGVLMDSPNRDMTPRRHLVLSTGTFAGAYAVSNDAPVNSDQDPSSLSWAAASCSAAFAARPSGLAEELPGLVGDATRPLQFR